MSPDKSVALLAASPSTYPMNEKHSGRESKSQRFCTASFTRAWHVWKFCSKSVTAVICPTPTRRFAPAAGAEVDMSRPRIRDLRGGERLDRRPVAKERRSLPVALLQAATEPESAAGGSSVVPFALVASPAKRARALAVDAAGHESAARAARKESPHRISSRPRASARSSCPPLAPFVTLLVEDPSPQQRPAGPRTACGRGAAVAHAAAPRRVQEASPEAAAVDRWPREGATPTLACAPRVDIFLNE
eukprot:scaffold6273_cov376-Prasinococcus_capsulatus_cf.AAC.4